MSTHITETDLYADRVSAALKVLRTLAEESSDEPIQLAAAAAILDYDARTRIV